MKRLIGQNEDIEKCKRCQGIFSPMFVPSLSGVCWPCFDDTERLQLKERLLSSPSLADKAHLAFIEVFEVEIEGGPEREISDGTIDMKSGYERRFRPPDRRRRWRGWVRK